jgi:hypothetical protein
MENVNLLWENRPENSKRIALVGLCAHPICTNVKGY